MTLDPLAAVEQPAQGSQGPVDLRAQGIFHGMDRAHLIGYRADAADASRDIGSLAEVAAAQEGLEEAGRLEDLQLHVDHRAALQLHVKAALALDAGKVINLEAFGLHGLHSPVETLRRKH